MIVAILFIRLHAHAVTLHVIIIMHVRVRPNLSHNKVDHVDHHRCIHNNTVIDIGSYVSCFLLHMHLKWNSKL